MIPQEAIEAIKIKQIEISGNAIRVAKFFEGISVANDALEKQIPKKVDAREEDRSIKIYRCFTCGKPIATSICGDIVVGDKQNYCDRCGQALDWSDTE